MFNEVRRQNPSPPEGRRFGEVLENFGILESANPKLFRFLRLCGAYPEIKKIDHLTFVAHAKDREVFS